VHVVRYFITRFSSLILPFLTSPWNCAAWKYSLTICRISLPSQGVYDDRFGLCNVVWWFVTWCIKQPVWSVAFKLCIKYEFMKLQWRSNRVWNYVCSGNVFTHRVSWERLQSLAESALTPRHLWHLCIKVHCFCLMSRRSLQDWIWLSNQTHVWKKALNFSPLQLCLVRVSECLKQEGHKSNLIIDE
jgi:hypothetical protein